MSFIIKPINAMLTKNLDIFSKMDPYCIIKIGNQKQKTKTHQGGGKNPQWADTFQFKATGNHIMNVQVWDKDILKNDFIGQGTYNLSQLYNFPQRTQNQYIDLYKNGKCTGRILISFQYIGPSMMSQNQGFGYQQQQNMYPQNYGNVPQYGTNQGIGNNSNMNKNMGNLPPQNYGPGNMQNKQNQYYWGPKPK